MNNKLSIIIPCYNCEETLEEAVESIYKQDLDNFEIVMVDDKSTDGTANIMRNLSEKNSEIKLFFNEENLGGGVTRNEAVSKCLNEIIFCLDADDILGDGSLKKMLGMIIEKNCDAVGIGKSIKFKGKDTENISYIDTFNKYSNIKIPIISLFEEGTCPLVLVCMFTKNAFNTIGGYPTNHGFDTQGFGFRFLLNNLEAFVCNESTYLHRINFHKSYYLREYESGKVNHNFYHVFEEFLYMFEENVIDQILNFNLNDPEKILFSEIKKNDKILKNDCFDYQPDINNKYDKYWIALDNYNKKKYSEAQKLFEELTFEIPNNLYVHYYINECCKKNGSKSNLLSAKKIDKLLSYREQGDRVNFLIRGFRKVYRLIREKI